MNLKYAVESHNVTRILGYLRKSRQDIEREKRTGEDTLSEQSQLMNNVLTSIEIPYDIEMEIGSGENIENRPVFKKCLDLLEEGKYEAIAVKELSRLSRGNYSDAGRIIQLINENRIIIITPYKVYDPRNTMDMKQIRFELFLAREEYEMIRERMTGARYTYAAQGKWVAGKAPYGFSYDKRSQRLVENPEQAKIVRLIFDLFLNGLDGKDYSYQAIASHLTKLGIPTAKGKKTWSYAQIRTMLENDIYIGTIRFRTHERNKKGQRIERPSEEHIIVEDAHTPLIDKFVFAEVQKKIDNKRPAPHNPLAFDPWELASVCTCSVCGGNLVRNAQKKKYKQKKTGDEVVYYQEFLKCQRNYCMSVKYRAVEKAILDYMDFLANLSHKNIESHINELLKSEVRTDSTKTKEGMLYQISSKEKELKNRLEFIFDKYEQGIYSDEIFLSRKEAIDNELKSLQEAKSEVTQNAETVDSSKLDDIKNSIEEFKKAYLNAKDRKYKNQILRNMFDSVEVIILEKGIGSRPAKFKIRPKLAYNLLRPINKSLI